MAAIGLDRVLNKLEQIGVGLAPALRSAGDRAADIALDAVPPYPAPPPNSTHDRTFDLGESITNEPDGIGAGITSFSRRILSIGVPYGPFVVDELNQAGIHKDRWWTIQQIAKKIAPPVLQAFVEAIRDLIRGR